MNFLELVHTRYACRSYLTRQVEDEKLDYILECARQAPSAVNFQPWHFVVVRSGQKRQMLQQCYDRDWFRSAPVYIVVCADESVAWTRKSDNMNHACIDAAIAAEHICLAAADVGLGSCWVCNFDAELFRRLFSLPEGMHPVVFIPLGHIDRVPERKMPRKPINEIVSVV